MGKKVAVILSGSGVFDGTELHEVVIANLALHRHGFETEFLAPNIEQAHVFDHGKGEPAEGETRNVLTEAARIARGQIKDLSEASVSDYAGVVFPGGFGVAKNLSSFAFDGAEMKVHDGIHQFISDTKAAKKPLVFLCISPVVAAKSIGNGVELTIGENPDVAGAIDAMGGKHIQKKVNECHVDHAHKVVSAPAYMYEAPIDQVAEGIEKAISEFTKLTG